MMNSEVRLKLSLQSHFTAAFHVKWFMDTSQQSAPAGSRCRGPHPLGNQKRGHFLLHVSQEPSEGQEAPSSLQPCKQGHCTAGHAIHPAHSRPGTADQPLGTEGSGGRL